MTNGDIQKNIMSQQVYHVTPIQSLPEYKLQIYQGIPMLQIAKYKYRISLPFVVKREEGKHRRLAFPCP
jgi:hypothetical protein